MFRKMNLHRKHNKYERSQKHIIGCLYVCFCVLRTGFIGVVPGRKGIMKKKDDSLRQKLLNTARVLAEEEGIDKLNIRSISKKAGVASGTVYNYFSGKDEILLILTKEYWKQTLLEMDAAISAESFCEALLEMILYLKERIRKPAGEWMNRLGGVRLAGQESMASAQEELKQMLLRRMEQDPNIWNDIWDDSFTKEQFSEFIRMNLMELLKTEGSQTEFFIRVIQRMIYRQL